MYNSSGEGGGAKYTTILKKIKTLKKKAEFKIGTETLKNMVGAKYNRIVMNMPSKSTFKLVQKYTTSKIIERSSVNLRV